MKRGTNFLVILFLKLHFELVSLRLFIYKSRKYSAHDIIITGNEVKVARNFIKFNFLVL